MGAVFEGGAAAGKELPIQRLPVYLRVVVDAEGKLDALDQVEDVAAPGEQIHVYMRTEHYHVSGANRVKDSYWMAFYAALPHVDGEQLRDNAAWQAWATAQPDFGAGRKPTAVAA